MLVCAYPRAKSQKKGIVTPVITMGAYSGDIAVGFGPVREMCEIYYRVILLACRQSGACRPAGHQGNPGKDCVPLRIRYGEIRGT